MSYIYVVQMNIPAQHEAEFNRVYDTEHVPMLSKVPGVNKVTRYRLERSTRSIRPTLSTARPGKRPANGATGRPKSGRTRPSATTATSKKSRSAR